MVEEKRINYFQESSEQQGKKVGRNTFMLMKEFHFRWILSSANFGDWHMAYATDG